MYNSLKPQQMHGVNGDKHAISIVLIIAYKTTVTVNKNSFLKLTSGLSVHRHRRHTSP